MSWRRPAKRARASDPCSFCRCSRRGWPPPPKTRARLLVWQPLATTARKLCPADFDALDRASGGRFPFSAEQIEAAHARWSADWLAWERTHDTEYKLKAATVEAELASSGRSALGRARLDAVEREKLDTYQRRYEEYARVSKALRALTSSTGDARPG